MVRKASALGHDTLMWVGEWVVRPRVIEDEVREVARGQIVQRLGCPPQPPTPYIPWIP